MKDLQSKFLPYDLASAFEKAEMKIYDPFGYWNQIAHSGKWELDNRIWENATDYIEAPLWQDAIEWLREEHKIYAYVQLTGNSFKQRYIAVIINRLNPNNTKYHGEFDSFYEALTATLAEAIKLVPKK